MLPLPVIRARLTMAATPNVKSPPRKHAYPLCPWLITMSAIYAVAIRSRFLHIAKPLFSDKIPARSFRAGYPPAPHAEHVDHRPCRALKRATLHREPPLLSSAQPTCLRTLTGLSLRFGPQAPLLSPSIRSSTLPGRKLPSRTTLWTRPRRRTPLLPLPNY